MINLLQTDLTNLKLNFRCFYKGKCKEGRSLEAFPPSMADYFTL